jgi:hypothetical protein
MRGSVRMVVVFAALATLQCSGRAPRAAVAPSQKEPESLIEEPRNEDPNWTKAWTNIVPPNRVGQTFIAKEPVIRRIDVSILTTENGTGAEDSLTLEVLDESGNPVGAATQVVKAGFDGWLTFTLCQPAGCQVTPGARLRLWLRDTGKVLFGWRYGSDRYHAGVSFMGGKEDPRFDFLFRVEP